MLCGRAAGASADSGAPKGWPVQRLTISIDDSLAAAFDTFVAEHGYQNRSEAVRDLIRDRLEEERAAQAEGPACIAAVSYIYNHHERELAMRLAALQHGHHDLAVSTMHVHLDHDECMETVILRGALSQVRGFADALVAERGVRHGKINLVPLQAVEPAPGSHHHVHYRART